MSKVLAEIAKAIAYNPVSGEFIWARDVASRVKAGSPAGTIGKGGYRTIGLHRRYVRAHRLAYFIVFGRAPIGVIDHINGDKLDNRIANLRECSHAENGQNSKASRNNTSGYVGVTWHRRRQKWCASIRVNYRGVHLGYFVEKEDAYAAYLAAKAKYHPAAPFGCGLPPAGREYDPSKRARKSSAMLNPSDERVAV